MGFKSNWKRLYFKPESSNFNIMSSWLNHLYGKKSLVPENLCASENESRVADPLRKLKIFQSGISLSSKETNWFIFLTVGSNTHWWEKEWVAAIDLLTWDPVMHCWHQSQVFLIICSSRKWEKRNTFRSLKELVIVKLLVAPFDYDNV